MIDLPAQTVLIVGGAGAEAANYARHWECVCSA
jgi:hypothetical protein